MFSTADPFFLTFTPKRDADSISHRRPQNGAALRIGATLKMAPPSKWHRPQNGAALKMAPPSKWRRPQNGAALKIGDALKMAPPSKWRRPQSWRHPQNGAATSALHPVSVSAHARCTAPLPLLLRNGSPRACALRAFARPGRTIVRGRGGGQGAGGVRGPVSGGWARILR